MEDFILDNEMDFVSEEELKEAIMKLKVGKAVGRDNIIHKIIKYMGWLHEN